MNIQELRTKKASLFNEMKGVYDVAKTEKRAVSSDDLTKAEKIEADLVHIERQITSAESFQQRAAEYETKKDLTLDTKGGDLKIRAFNQYLRRGMAGVDALLRPYLTRGTSVQTTVDAKGGYTVPEGWLGEIDVAKQFIGEVEGVSRVISTSTGNILPFPKIDDTATDGAKQTEGSAVTVADMAFGVTNLSAYTYATLVKVSEQLVQDEEVDLTRYLTEMLGQRIARVTNGALTKGDGSSNPNGVVTAATTGKTAASATAFTHEELIDLYYSVDPSYRMGENVKFMCHDAVHSYIRKLGLITAENYNPISFGPDGTMFIMGKEVKINQDMDSAITSAKKTLLFGDFNGYAVRTTGGINISVLRERYADELNYGYIAYRRLDGNLISGGVPLKLLVQAS